MDKGEEVSKPVFEKEIDKKRVNLGRRFMLVCLFPLYTFFISTCTSVSEPAEFIGPVLPTLAITAAPVPTETSVFGVEGSFVDLSLPATNTPLASVTRAEEPPPPTETATPLVTNTPTQIPRSTATDEPADVVAQTPFAQRIASSNSPNLATTLLPSDPVFYGTSIDFLSAQVYGNGYLTITRKIGTADLFTRYEYIYDSDRQIVTGFLNVPTEEAISTLSPDGKIPVALVLHGYIPPDEYKLLDYTARYADHLARAGFVTFHPNYRGHPPKPNSRNENVFRIEYAVDVLNLMALIRKESMRQENGLFGQLDTSGYYVMGHSMGGGIGQRVMTIRPDWVKGLVLYGSMSGNEALNYEKIKIWGGDRYWRTEFWAPESVIREASPIYFLDRWEAPVSIHHGTADETVPIEWSRNLCSLLEGYNHPTDCYEYRAYPHSFYGRAEEQFIERMVAFFQTASDE